MKIFLIKSCIFLILITFSNVLYLLLIQKTDWNFIKRIQSLNFNDPKFEILVLGNSLALDGIDTHLMTTKGHKSYNLAIGGSSIETSYLQLQEYLLKYDYKPKYVLIGHASYTGFLKSKPIQPIVDFTRSDKKYGLSDIPMLKFKWLFKEFLKKIVSKKHREAYLDYGQLKFDKTIPDKSKIDLTNVFEYSTYEENPYVRKLVDICYSNKIKLYFIEMPGAKKDRHPKIFDYKILDNNKMHGYIYDFNTIEFGNLFDDNEDWIGNSHLNEKGALKFTEILINELSL